MPAQGFSLSELDDAGVDLDQAERLGLPVDAGRIGAYGPNVTVLPGDEKTIEEFQGDDTACRQWASRQGSTTATEGSTSNSLAWSSAPAQRRYDLAYAQCMYTKGNQVPISNSLQAGLVPVSRACRSTLPGVVC